MSCQTRVEKDGLSVYLLFVSVAFNDKRYVEVLEASVIPPLQYFALTELYPVRLHSNTSCDLYPAWTLDADLVAWANQ